MSVTEPSIDDLLTETRCLAKTFREFRERYPDSLVFRYILSVHWRADVRETITKPDVKDGTEYLAALWRYIGNVSRYFVDWMERPERFERFPLSRCLTSPKRMEATEPEEFLNFLKEHEELLLIEQSKQQGRTSVRPKGRNRSPVPKKFTRQNFPRLLKRAREHLGYSQETAAKKCSAKLDTYKAWEQGRHFPQLESRRFAEEYIRSSLSDEAPDGS